MAPRASNANKKGKGRATQAQPESSDVEDEEEEVPSGALSNKDIESRAGMLVRFALFQEYRRVPIRRADAAKEVVPNNKRSFKAVLVRAQEILRETFGCEMVELRKKNEGAAAPDASVRAQQSQAAATQSKKNKGKGRARPSNGGLNAVEEEEEEDEEDDEPAATQRTKETGSGVYILQSTLPSSIIDFMNNPRPLPQETQDQVEEAEDSGALLPWDKADGGVIGHVGLMGLRTLILSLIMGLGRATSDDNLHALLKRLNLHRETVLPYSSKDNTGDLLTLDKFLDQLARTRYLEKIDIPGHGGGREGASCEWKWGARAEVEFSTKAAAKFIEEIMIGKEGESDDEEEEGQPRRGANSRARGEEEPEETNAHKRRKLKEDLVKASGLPLTGRD
ncbi:hypothetical protein L198_03867 [Cryptococcus wingfieldii CBS 7118]|uniref:MAGE domain-containing protein n=1 Tax=Cryptococcus wingfieldii CBS 7118 TaxID=1295528 RepID=A0A1E3J8X1_9TREE|nr:hypothetical protein L198_03867 [Cryptococcus wingfieldii CBS 7118]ODN97304.1 hypothetical protein L198_03867 [Cryptococcus wingfieldii CBS 7118]